ncbi:MAG: GTP cyclohydrolase FolE2 [Bacillota bacterium]
MRDIQNSPDERGIGIHKVGVKEIHMPFLIATRSGGQQSVQGQVELSANLSHQYRGTHLSRFVETLNQWSAKPISGIRKILEALKEKLSAERTEISMKFRYFLPITAPVSGSVSYLDYLCEFAGVLWEKHFNYFLSVEIPVVSLCPCSKEISNGGAHNQRANIRVKLRFKPGKFLWIEDVVELLSGCGSAPIYPLLKREDEKYVTEKSYDNPKFVEDILRDCVIALRAVPALKWFEVTCESYESIHNHNAFAYHQEEL